MLSFKFLVTSPFKSNPSIYNFRCSSLFTASLSLTTLFFISRNSPTVGQDLLIYEVSRSHTTTHHSRQDSSGRVISSSHRHLPDNTQHSQQTDIDAPSGFRTHNPSRQSTSELRQIDRAAIGIGSLPTLDSLKYRLIFTLKY